MVLGGHLMTPIKLKPAQKPKLTLLPRIGNGVNWWQIVLTYFICFIVDIFALQYLTCFYVLNINYSRNTTICKAQVRSITEPCGWVWKTREVCWARWTSCTTSTWLVCHCSTWTGTTLMETVACMLHCQSSFWSFCKLNNCLMLVIEHDFVGNIYISK